MVRITIENAKDLCEVENLIMMAERHQRYFGEYARNGLAALRSARREYLGNSETENYTPPEIETGNSIDGIASTNE
jgi:hypothetical protein